MTKDERKSLAIVLLCLCLISATLVYVTFHQFEEQQESAKTHHKVDVSSLSFVEALGVAHRVYPDHVDIEWPAQSRESILVETEPILLQRQGAREWQFDVYMGGTQNTAGKHTYGFRAWVEAELLYEGELCGTEKTELFLRSENGRGRLYSFTIEADTAKVDAYRLRWLIQSTQGGLPEGMLKCTSLEVLIR